MRTIEVFSKKMSKIFKLFILAMVISAATSQLEGCIVMAVGAGVGAWKYGSAKQKEAMAKSQEAYDRYVINMQALNLQRERQHFKIIPILSYEEYLKSGEKK